jgi:hypothetical protein
MNYKMHRSHTALHTGDDTRTSSEAFTLFTGGSPQLCSHHTWLVRKQIMVAIGYNNRLIEMDDDDRRHWSESEKFSPADALMSALEQGWQIYGVVFRQEFWHNAGRRVPVYHFKLERADTIMPMAVIENPFINRLLQDRRVRVVRINERKQQSVNERW